jgi:hypothetical protein
MGAFRASAQIALKGAVIACETDEEGDLYKITF